MSADEQAIRDHHATWMEAANAVDLARLLPMLADDVVLMGPGQAPIGKESYPAVFLGGHEKFELRCDSELLEVVVAGDLAYTRCRDSVFIKPRAGGDEMTLSGARLTVYRKEAGRWLLARDAHTLAPSAG